MTATCIASAASALVCVTFAANVASAAMFDVTVNTSSIAGTTGKLVVDYTVNQPPSGRHVEVHDFVTNSIVAALPETEGGLVEGNVFLPPFTTIGASLNSAVGFAEIGGGQFFNELMMNLTFGTTISFELHVPEYAPLTFPDQVALFLLRQNGLPLFPTSDPTGADALFIVDISGTLGVTPTAFSPTTLTGTNVNIVTPGGETPTIPEPTTITLVMMGLGAGLGRQMLRR
jgi:hypothetical protein